MREKGKRKKLSLIQDMVPSPNIKQTRRNAPFPTPPPIDFGAAAIESPPRRCERASRRARTPPAPPAPPRAPPPRALGPPGPAGRGAVRLRRRPALSGPEHRHRRTPLPWRRSGPPCACLWTAPCAPRSAAACPHPGRGSASRVAGRPAPAGAGAAPPWAAWPPCLPPMRHKA